MSGQRRRARTARARCGRNARRTPPMLAAAGLLLTCSLPTAANDETEAVIDELARNCRERLVEQFGVPATDLSLRLSADLRHDLDSGMMPLAELNAYGASFDWTVRGLDENGYCNVDGDGTIIDFVEW
jgi:hypothetical protein